MASLCGPNDLATQEGEGAPPPQAWEGAHVLGLSSREAHWGCRLGSPGSEVTWQGEGAELTQAGPARPGIPFAGTHEERELLRAKLDAKTVQQEGETQRK